MLKLTLLLVAVVRCFGVVHTGSPMGSDLGSHERASAPGTALSQSQVQFLSKLFPLVGELTINRRFASPLRAAVDTQPVDDESIAAQLAELMITVDGDSGVEFILNETESEKVREIDSGIEKESFDKKWVTLLDRILWAAKRLEGKIVTISEQSKPFSDSFRSKFEDEMRRADVLRNAVRDGNLSFLRDPKNLDHEALTSFLINSRDRQFVSDLAQKFTFDKTLFLTTPGGETMGVDLSDSPESALAALKTILPSAGARISAKQLDPAKRFSFNGTSWTEKIRTTADPIFYPKAVSPTALTLPSQAQAIFNVRCTECHGVSDIRNWNPSAVLRRVTSTSSKTRMPKERHPLSPSEIAIIRDWAEAATPSL